MIPDATQCQEIVTAINGVTEILKSIFWVLVLLCFATMCSGCAP